MGNAFIVKPLAWSIIAVNTGGTAAGTSENYLSNDYIGMVWRSTSTSGNVVIDFDFGAAVGVDTIAALSSNAAAPQIQVFGATSQANLNVSGYIGGAQTLAAGATLPTSGRTNALVDLGSVQTYRWWRIIFVSLSAALDVGRVVIGQKISLTRNFTFDAHARGVKDFGSVDFTKDGGLLRRPGVKLRRVDIGWQSNTLAETESSILPLLETVGATSPILICTNPDVDTQRANRMYFGWLTSDLSTPIRAFDTWTWRASLISVI